MARSASSSLPILLASVLSAGVAVAAGCGSESSTFNENGSSGTNDGGGATSAFPTGEGGASGSSSGEGGASCRTTENAAELQAVYLGFAFDVSGSMGQLDCPFWNHNPQIKWRPVVDAVVAFFQDPASTNLNASMALFPSDGDQCPSDRYKTPDVPMTELPSTAFAQRLQAYEVASKLATYTDPMPPEGGGWRGGTPTAPAVKGVLESLKPVQVAHPDAKVAIVLVTDGLPQGSCANNAIGDVTGLVTTAKDAGVPTYVIGVRDPATPPATAPWAPGGTRAWACPEGESWRSGYSATNTPKPTNPALLDNLNAIAVAGGTTAAFLIDTGNPTATNTAFRAAVNDIRARSISCELKRPAPPPGETFDPNKVNVRYDSGAARTPLHFDAECKADNAWRYKSGGTDVIELCPTTCAAVQRDPVGVVQVEFGCVRRDVLR